jgi:uncharacterized protein with FMN-binding domain
MLVFIIDKIGFKSTFDIKKLFIPLIAIVVIIGIMTFVIADKFNVDETASDPNFSINKVETNGNNVIYTVTEKGYSSKIELKITISNGKITAATVISQGDSFFSKVNDAKYLDKLIAQQDALKDCDTVSGATVSSTAVKKAFINTLEDYNNGGYKSFDNDKVTETPEETTNPDFVINSKKEVAGAIVYNVNQKSFNGFMNLEITIINSVVTNINIISYNDTCVSRTSLIKAISDIASVNPIPIPSASRILFIGFSLLATTIALPRTIQLTTISGKYIPSAEYRFGMYSFNSTSTMVTNVPIIKIYTDIFPISIFTTSAGAFLTLAFLIALFNKIKGGKKNESN